MKADKFLQDIPYIVRDFLDKCDKVHRKRTLFKLPSNIVREIRIKFIESGFELSLNYNYLELKALYIQEDDGIILKEFIGDN